MNLYFIVEGEQTEMKVYPEWLHFLAPQLEKVDDAWSIKPDSDSYYLFSAGGIPSIFKHVSNAVADINDINASKGNALNFLKDFWNIKKEEILASGDQDNDIELLKNAGVKVCVGKNSKKLYELADYNCKDVNSDELVEVIKKYL